MRLSISIRYLAKPRTTERRWPSQLGLVPSGSVAQESASSIVTNIGTHDLAVSDELSEQLPGTLELEAQRAPQG